MKTFTGIRKLAFCVVLGFAGFFANMANASLITWTFSGATFNDGGTLSGWFMADTDTGTVTNWDITTTAGSSLPGFHFDLGSSYLYGYNVWSSNPNSFVLVRTAPFAQPYINLSFDASWLTSGVLNFDTSGFTAGTWECNNCASVRFLTSGQATSVPEPMGIALFGLGLLALILPRRARQK